jgi:hypothetical protein
VRADSCLLVLALALGCFGVGGCTAAASTGLFVPLLKEPGYRATPGYLLLHFGREAEQRMWMVLDGDTLYVDRNGNGDLTDADERIERDPDDRNAMVFGVTQLCLKPDEKAECTLFVTVDAKDPRLLSEVSLRAPGWSKRHTQTTQGRIPLAQRPKDAPIVHFGGPLTLTLMEWEGDVGNRELRRGCRYGLSILVGTPVRGTPTETFSALMPGFGQLTSAVPVVEVEFPSRAADGRLVVRGKARLCECGNRFLGSVEVPEGVGEGKAILTLSFPGWREDRVTPARIEFSISKGP